MQANGRDDGVVLECPAEWDGLTKVNVDLSSVVGSPGIQTVRLLQDGVEALGTRFVQRALGGSLFLVGSPGHELSGPPVAQASGFLGQLASPESAAPDNLKVLVTQQTATGTHVVAQQTIRGAEVVGARFRLHTRQGRPYACTGRPVGDLALRDPGDPPATTEEDAAARIREELRLGPEHDVTVTRVVFPIQQTGVWAFAGRTVLHHPAADVRIYLRADDLSVMLSYNVASAVGPADPAPTPDQAALAAVPVQPEPLGGRAQVYAVNPLRTPDLLEVDLAGIGPDPSDLLAGSMVSVQPRIPPPVQRLDRDFRLQPEAMGFDEVQAYFHLGEALGFYSGLLAGSMVDAPPFRPVRAVVRDFSAPNNALFVPDTGELLFGDVGDRPTARCAEIIYHELGHAVSDGICRLGRGLKDGQARGMSEGYSDYLASSALDDARVGDYVANDPNGARNCSNPDLRFAPGYAGGEHSTGAVWAAVLWEVRRNVGQDAADRIALESLHFLDPNSTFDEGLQALLTADANLFPDGSDAGQHGDAIQTSFDARKP
jgi:fungalysin metallopeptidase (M36)/fungalysin/thermolysin propeptide